MDKSATCKKNWLTDEWTKCKPSEVGIDIHEVNNSIEYLKSNFPAYRTFNLYKDGYLVYENINKNVYESVMSKVIRRTILLLYKSKNIPTHTFIENYGELYNIRSATKSIISLLIGIAIDKGLIDNTEQKVKDFFPEYSMISDKDEITIQHLLTMKSGLGPIENSMISALKFLKSKDWVKYIFDLPLQFKPGERFHYNSGNTHILSAIITKVSGMNAYDFAEKYLFNPLGIKDYVWEQDPCSNNFGGGNLFMKPCDMAKIGCLLLNNGLFENEQIVSSDWINKSFERQHHWDYGFDYGFLWYIKDEPLDDKEKKYITYSAAGAGGQKILIVPEKNIVLVTTSNVDLIKDKSYFLNLVVSNHMKLWVKK